MVYKIHDEETGGLIDEIPTFETLDDWENYLNKIAEHWCVIGNTKEGIIYEISFGDDNLVNFIAKEYEVFYKIYDDETGEPTGHPFFGTLDEWEDYLDNNAKGWSIIEDTGMGVIYEINFEGEESVNFIAVLTEI